MRARKADANQPAVIAALRKVGASVQPLHTVGEGVPDLLVGFRAKNLLMEVKDGDKPPSAQKLTEDQLEWRAGWRGSVVTVNSPEAAIKALEEA